MCIDDWRDNWSDRWYQGDRICRKVIERIDGKNDKICGEKLNFRKLPRDDGNGFYKEWETACPSHRVKQPYEADGRHLKHVCTT